MRESDGTISGREKSVCGEQRNDAERIDARRDQRTARRQEIGSRTRRRRDANAVGRNLRRVAVVDAKSERNESRDFAFAYDHVVEREETPLAVLGLQRASLVDEETAREQAGKIGEPRIVFVELGKEPQAPRVDAEQRYVVVHRKSRGAQ